MASTEWFRLRSSGSRLIVDVYRLPPLLRSSAAGVHVMAILVCKGLNHDFRGHLKLYLSSLTTVGNSEKYLDGEIQTERKEQYQGERDRIGDYLFLLPPKKWPITVELSILSSCSSTASCCSTVLVP
jgi:hypothetical protein